MVMACLGDVDEASHGRPKSSPTRFGHPRMRLRPGCCGAFSDGDRGRRSSPRISKIVESPLGATRILRRRRGGRGIAPEDERGRHRQRTTSTCRVCALTHRAKRRPPSRQRALSVSERQVCGAGGSGDGAPGRAVHPAHRRRRSSASGRVSGRGMVSGWYHCGTIGEWR